MSERTRTVVGLLLLVGVAVVVGGVLLNSRGGPRRIAPPATQPPEAAKGTPARPGPGSPETRPGPTLLVVDAVDRHPLAGAEVTYVDLGAIDSREKFESIGLRDELVVRRGTTVGTDAEGRVTLPAFGGEALIRAHAAGLWGQIEIANPGADELTLSLSRDRGVSVAVVDPQGAPMPGVPVALFESSREGGPGDLVLWRGVTAEETGIAEIPHLQWYVTRLEERAPLAPGAALFVTLHFPTKEPVRVTLDPQDLPAGPIRIAAPATGSLRVRVIGKNERPYLGEMSVFVSAAGAGAGSATGDLATFVQFTKSGVAEFPWIEVGTRLRIAAGWPASGFDTAEDECEGPSEAGEQVEAVLRLEVKHPVVVARILGADGAPLGDRDVRIGFALARPSTMPIPLRTNARSDGDGAVRHPLQMLRGRSFPRILEFVVPFAEAGLEEEPEWWGQATLPAAPDEGGEYRLGDIRLERVPLVVSGRVVDADGKPLGDARVSVAAEGAVFAGTTHADGSFRIHGRGAEGSLEVAAAKARFEIPEPLEAQPGAEGVEIVLRPATMVRGRVLVGEGVPLEKVFVWVADASRKHEAFLRSGGEFAFYVAPGTVNVEVRLRSESEPIYAFEGLEVPEGEETDLGDIDLRERIRVLPLAVVDEARQPVAGAWVLAATGENAGTPLGQTDTFGRIRLPAAGSGTLDCLVGRRGYRSGRIGLPAKNPTLLLRPPLRVRLVAPEGVAPPAPPLALTCVLEIEAAPQDPVAVWRSRFLGFNPGHVDSGNGVTLDVAESGPYRAVWRLTLEGDFLVDGQPVRELTEDVGDGHRVVVTETDDRQTFEVPLTAEQMLAAKARLEERSKGE